jgi:rhodanese-related sulfurtransferase
MTKRTNAEQLRAVLCSENEAALLDVREEAVFSRGHLLWAVCLPLSQLELGIANLVPRREVPIVLCDEGDGSADLAASRLAQFGYDDVAVLDGGIAAWTAAGFELFSGVNVPSKAFGEFIEHAYDTPSIPASELQQLLDAKEDMVVLDSRPLDEYRLMSIPTGVCTPGAELVYRVHQVAPSPDTLVVVNCAGRTRSIIGAQSLINAGIPNKVVALRNGTMGWHLEGLAVDSGSELDMPEVGREAIELAQARTRHVAQRFGVKFLSRERLAQFESDDSRTLFVLDVRSPAEFAKGHLRGAQNAPGGQLVQATDAYVGVRGARIVLVDDSQVRSIMTASWLIQMGWHDVWVLDSDTADEPIETGAVAPIVLGLEGLEVEMLSAPELSRLLDEERATVVDLSSSREFRAGHICGARHSVRARLPRLLAAMDVRGRLVLTSSDGVLARLAAHDMHKLGEADAHVLMGGNAAWRDGGFSLSTGDDGLEEHPDDVWLRPYEDTENIEQAMRNYLEWEIDLVGQIDRDGTTNFERFD